MRTTIFNHPGFYALPKAIKRMLVTAEAHFFDQPASHCKEQMENGSGHRPAWEPLSISPWLQCTSHPVLSINQSGTLEICNAPTR
jgi:hypothetical protein